MARAVKFSGNDQKKKNPAEARPQTDEARCWRCRGLMVVEECFEFAGDGGHVDCVTQRCVQCGEVIDPVILQNRRLQTGKCVDRV